MFTIKNIKLDLNEDLSSLEKKIIRRLRLSNVDKIKYKIIKESIDARKGRVIFIYQVIVDDDYKKFAYLKDDDIIPIEKSKLEKNVIGERLIKNRPLVIGFGPAGIFAALTLAREGYKPIVYELGKDVDNRSKDVEAFWRSGILNESSNVQYGEGGAGTFSDGKLTTRIKDERVNVVLETLHSFGGPAEILYSHKAHIGTDILKNVVKNIRNEIINLGGKIYFNSEMNNITIQNNKLRSISINGMTIETNACILAVGNSGRKTYRMLDAKGLDLIQKPFAVGFRIEHPRIEIDKSQYKENYLHPRLKSASYNLTSKTSNGKSCYTFCMCPGGEVIGASSEDEGLVVNGMSYHSRDLENSNSAVLCTVGKEDYGDRLFDGMNFQIEIERKAYILGGGNFVAPVQTVGDYLNGIETTKLGKVMPSYRNGYKLTDLNNIYPMEVNKSIKESLINYSKKINAFKMEDAILTGVETRSSSPIRIIRNDKFMCDKAFGLFPAGEGAGYSGGIISSAVDGIKCAEALISIFKR